MGQHFLWSCLGHVCDDMKCHAPTSKIIRWLKQLVVSTCKTSTDVCLQHSEDELPPRWPQVEFAIWKVDLDSSVTWWKRPMWFQFFVVEVKTASPQGISTLGLRTHFQRSFWTSLWTHLFASFCTQEGIFNTWNWNPYRLLQSLLLEWLFCHMSCRSSPISWPVSEPLGCCEKAGEGYRVSAN